MRRRDFVAFLGGALAWPVAASAQQASGEAGKLPRLGILMQAPSEQLATHSLEPLYQGLHELGYLEGRNITIERRFGTSSHLHDLAVELAGLKVDVIYAWGTPATRAAKEATSTIPIVADIMADPVGDELVASLARPGGNITGTTLLVALVAKRLQYLAEIVPNLSRVAALWHPPPGYSERTRANILKEAKDAALALGLRLQLVQVLCPDDFESAFSAMTGERADALIVLPSPMLFIERNRIVDLEQKSRLPAVHTAREYAEAGGLMSYGPNYTELTRRAAWYVDKILKGAKPADLPVEQPTKFELVINLRAASALGVSVPPLLQARATELIE